MPATSSTPIWCSVQNSRSAAIHPRTCCFTAGCASRSSTALGELQSAVPGIGVLVGYPEYAQGRIYNAAALLRGGHLLAQHRKSCLPNYKVFDEKRYFAAGASPTLVEFDGFRFGVLICEDVWEPEPCAALRTLGAEALLVINASPYEIHKQREREQVLGARVRETGLPALYVNLLGGQDELVFDGNSFAMDARGRIAMRAPPFEAGLYLAELERTAAGVEVCAAPVAPELRDEESVYRALVTRRARLRGQARLSGRGDRALGRRGFRAHARDRGGCARARARACGHDALALHLADESRGRGGAGPRARGVAQFDPDRGHVRRHARGPRRRSSRAVRRMRPKRTSRPVAAACC